MSPAPPTRIDLDDSDARQLRNVLRDIAEDVRKKTVDGPYAHNIEVLRHLYGEEKCQTLGIYQIPDGFVLSVVIPAYNEVETIESILARVRNTGLPVEMIVVDDGSTDGTRELLHDLQRQKKELFELVLHERNQGKGAAVRTGLLKATGNVVVIQDADLEYDPEDFHLLLQPILEDEADIVYGSRFLGGDKKISPAWHRRGNEFLTYLSNRRTGLKITDVETCYKMFRRELIQPVAETLRERGFGVELEITAKCARLPNVRFEERPIRYSRRSYAEGKKIGMKDAIWALWCLARY
ncbi:MAG: glycosyltransferase family 2 protein [Pirellulales bacterium]